MDDLNVSVPATPAATGAVSNKNGGNHSLVTVTANSGATFDLNLAQGDWFKVIVSNAPVLRITNAPAGFSEFHAIITATSDWTYSGTVNQQGNSSEATNNGNLLAECIIRYYTYDGGTNWTYTIERTTPIPHASTHAFGGTDSLLSNNTSLGTSTAVAPTQNAVKSYVDAVAQGLSPKATVRVATVVAGTLASSFENGDTVDGIVLVTADRILIKDQVDPKENGIYVVAASGTPTRSTDADTGAEILGAFCFIREGTTNHDQGFVCTTDSAITIGVTNIVFAQFTSVAAAAAGALRSFAKAIRTSANVSVTSTSPALFTADLDLQPNAAAGDILEVNLNCDKQGSAGGNGIGFDVVIVDGSNVVLKALSSETATPKALGIGGGWYSATALQYDNISSTFSIVLDSGDITSGKVNLRVYAVLAGAGTVPITGSATLPIRFNAKVFRAPA